MSSRMNVTPSVTLTAIGAVRSLGSGHTIAITPSDARTPTRMLTGDTSLKMLSREVCAMPRAKHLTPGVTTPK